MTKHAKNNSGIIDGVGHKIRNLCYNVNNCNHEGNSKQSFNHFV